LKDWATFNRPSKSFAQIGTAQIGIAQIGTAQIGIDTVAFSSMARVVIPASPPKITAPVYRCFIVGFILQSFVLFLSEHPTAKA
jgi:hypothetical protein